MAKHPAVFLDRDGTIIEDNGYIKDPMDMIFYPETFRALQLLQDHFLLFIITNQSGISKGITTAPQVEKVNKHLVELLKVRGIAIYDLFSCPHKTEDNCSCKKPNPYFINKAAGLNNLNLAQSFIIGDHPSDVYCGINAGVKPIYVLTGHGKKHQHEITEEVITCKNVLDASNYIVSYKNNHERL
ncbi:MAG TPA: hypothetical protein DCR40_09280 [Prolixibacteraceae bacterium]|nr:hypothetical protein [Prolixibacteraceae bacterium]